MAKEDQPSIREHIFDAIEQTSKMGLGDSDTSDQDLPETSMLMGYVTVAEWMDAEGNRWLTKVSSDANRKSGPSWQIRGYLHDVLAPDWWDTAEDSD